MILIEIVRKRPNWFRNMTELPLDVRIKKSSETVAPRAFIYDIHLRQTRIILKSSECSFGANLHTRDGESASEN